jgi:hypothetical protein
MEKSQIAIDSLEFIKIMLSGEMTTEEKYLGMMELEKKYPGKGFGSGAQQFANNFLRVKSPFEVHSSPFEVHSSPFEVRDKKFESTGEMEEAPF